MTKPNFGADLRFVHRAMTRGIHVASECSGDFAQEGFPDAETEEGFRRYAQALVALLEAHHEGEDEIAWPSLRISLPDAPYARLTRDHNEISTTLAGARLALAENDLASLTRHLATLKTQWHAHIGVEEAAFGVDATAEALSDEAQAELSGKLSQHTLQHAEPSALVMPFMLYNLAEDDRNRLTGMVPPERLEQLMQAMQGPWRDQREPMKPFLLVD